VGYIPLNFRSPYSRDSDDDTQLSAAEFVRGAESVSKKHKTLAAEQMFGHVISNGVETCRSYPTDLTEQQWNRIEPLIPAVKPGGRPAKYPRREIVSAISYEMRGGAAWRMLPHDASSVGISSGVAREPSQDCDSAIDIGGRE